jgi:hypothetical protein
VSKFLLNLPVQILKVLPKFQKSLKFKNILFPLNSLLGSSPAGSASPRSPPLPQATVPFVGPLGPHVPLAYSTEYVFFFDSRLPSSTSSLSPLTDPWAPPVSSLSHPTSVDPGRAAVESHRGCPPCAAQLRALSGLLRALTHPAIRAPP